MMHTFAISHEQRQESEQRQLFRLAAFSADYQAREPEPEDSYRAPYKRDVDRILHSKAFSRYVDKTQVVYLVPNDHISHRALHVQLVSSLARGIAEVLQLNLSLVEAIALAHDVGHPPFGHEGEGYLSSISQEWGQGAFAHPWQSCRLFSVIEPLNLGFAVHDGILCHDGGLNSTHLVPNWRKTWADHQRELELRLQQPDAHILPATLEGCLVKICDTVSYLVRDIEDALNLGIIRRDQLPGQFKGDAARDLLRLFAEDLIASSIGQEHIAISEPIYEMLAALRKFSFDYIYFHPLLKKESDKIRRGYRLLLEFLLDDYRDKGEQSYIWSDFLHSKDEPYIHFTPPERQVIDYVAGMTDGFFLRTLQKVFIPSLIGLSC